MTTTRRNLLKLSGPALAAVALPAVAAQPVDPVVALVEKLRAAEGAAVAADNQCEDAYHAAGGAEAFGEPIWPKEWNYGRSYLGLSHCSDFTTTPHTVRYHLIRKNNAHTESIVAEGAAAGDPDCIAELARRKAEGHGRLRWWVARMREKKAMREAAGHPDALQASDRAWLAYGAIEQQLLHTPATTLQGIWLKLEIMAARSRVDIDCSAAERRDLDVEDDYMVSALRDFRALVSCT